MAKTAAVIGYGKSGAAAARVLKLQGYSSVDFYDDRKEGCKAIKEYKANYDMTVVSPGVPLHILPEKPAVYTSEIELAYSELPYGSKVLGITGTNGKSTVTHLATQILNNAGLKAVACGNIGYPFADAVLDEKADVYVLELSSFQLELIQDSGFELDAAVLTNLTPDHLDRYPSFDDYAAAKLTITQFIDSDGVFISDPDPYVVNKVLRAQYKVKYVDKELKAWPRLDGDRLKFDGFFVNTSGFKLFGWHNLLNLSFAIGLAASVLDAEGDMTHIIEGLTGMPHRTETVLVHNGITWINDSKATNVDSTLIALRSCKFPTIVLLGGYDKKGDFTQLVDDLNRVASMVVCFGGAADIIYTQLEGKLMFPLIKAAKLRGAVEAAYKEASVDGTTVILSPGCASYDEFNNFEERGEIFARYAREVTNAGA